MEITKEENLKSNVIELKEFLRYKLSNKIQSTVYEDKTFIFEASKLFKFILEFVRENELKLTDEEIILSLQTTFENLNKEYNTFKINLSV